MKKVKRLVLIAVVLPVVLTAGVGVVVAPGLSTLLSQAAAGPVVGAGPAAIPASMLTIYTAAAMTCPGLPWTVLAAIGTVESGNGTSLLPGVQSGQNAAGAEGPVQFEPTTFSRYAQPAPPGGEDPPSPYDPTDAVYAAARMLCADGAGDPALLAAAVYDYNHSESYVAQVLSVARSLAQTAPDAPAGPVGPVAAGQVALDYALAQVGTPYRWGGETPGAGFDCSGLAQAAWAAAGVTLPRVAQDQFAAGPAVPAGQALQPGDLVFFGSASAGVTHVGLVVDPGGLMVDAPHTGADVRIEPFPVAVGASWGADVYLGATAPAG